MRLPTAKDISSNFGTNHEGNDERCAMVQHPDNQVNVYAVLVLASIGRPATNALPTLLKARDTPDLSNYVAEALRRIDGTNFPKPSIEQSLD